MGIMIYRNKSAACGAAATIIGAELIKKPNCVLGLSVSYQVADVYQKLCLMTNEGVLDWSEAVTFHTGEIISRRQSIKGIQSNYLNRTLYERVSIEYSHVHAPNHKAQDLQAACTNYEMDIFDSGGMDILLLSLGQNGHLALNSPAREFSALTHVELLSQNTIEECERLYKGEAAESSQAIIMGISTLMTARHIILLAIGEEMKDLVKQMLSTSITPSVPASMLQLHPNVTYILDENAALSL